MGRKRRKTRKPKCWYCDREFEDEKVLIQHQKAKHFKCHVCHKKLSTASGMVIHVYQVHKETITEVPNAKEGKKDPNIEIYGMEGVPSDKQEPNKVPRTTQNQPVVGGVGRGANMATMMPHNAYNGYHGGPPPGYPGMPGVPHGFRGIPPPRYPGMNRMGYPPRVLPHQMPPYMPFSPPPGGPPGLLGNAPPMNATFPPRGGMPPGFPGGISPSPFHGMPGVPHGSTLAPPGEVAPEASAFPAYEKKGEEKGKPKVAGAELLWDDEEESMEEKRALLSRYKYAKEEV